MKNRISGTLNMASKKTSTFIFLFAIMTICFLGGFAACSAGSGKLSNNMVTINGINYVLQEDIALDFTGFSDFYQGLNELCEKTGTFRNADVYKIHGLESSEWIYLDNNDMLNPGNPPGGIYRSAAVKMDSIADFKPDYLVVHYLTPPTSGQSGTTIQWFDTADKESIERIVSAIGSGKAVSAEKQEEVSKAMLSWDSRSQRYRFDFSSENFPKLVYRLDYIEYADGKFYIGQSGETAAHKIIEIDNGLHDYLPNKAQ